MAEYPVATGEICRAFKPDDLVGIRRQFESFGGCIIDLLTQDECDANISAMMRKVEEQPFKPEYKLRLYDSHDKRVRVGDAGFLQLIKKPLSGKNKKALQRSSPPHRLFGASLLNWHTFWAIRQKPEAVAVGQAILGQTNVRVMGNRGVEKQPSQGMQEFPHWDVNMRTVDPRAPRQFFAGKVMLTHGSFIGMFGTQKPEFIEAYQQECFGPGGDYKHYSKKATKFTIDPLKDRRGIVGSAVKLVLKPGQWFIWDCLLGHGTNQLPADQPMQFALYLSYRTAEWDPGYKDKCGIDEKTDQIASYLTGVPPLLYQGSNDTAHHTPNNWTNFPASMAAFINKIQPGHPIITEKLCKAHNEMRPCIQYVPCETYRPFPLSDLGKKLIGIDEWAAAGSAPPTRGPPPPGPGGVVGRALV